MGGSDENKHGVIGPMNPQGGLRGGKVNPANGQTRRALSTRINRSSDDVLVYVTECSSCLPIRRIHLSST
uniref:Uncharacterized protein n=1 Tax=Brassica oleracea var. oleracea TaxID=109376 RepID=A0A0D3C571_BRAOL